MLEGMQQKLDDLLVEMSSLQQQYVKCDSYISDERETNEIAGSKNIGDGEGSRCCVCTKLEVAATPQKAKVALVDLLLFFLLVDLLLFFLKRRGSAY